MQAGVLATELGDPTALGGPIAFTIRKGQRLHAVGPRRQARRRDPGRRSSTGDIEIEFLTDGGGRLYRNPYQPADQRPENGARRSTSTSSFDVAVYAVDPTGNAVLAQTVLGVQASGTAIADRRRRSRIETVAAMELGLLGVTTAPSNLVLELHHRSDRDRADADTTRRSLVASYPRPPTSPSTRGIELIFDEPIDLDRARAGGILLQDAGGADGPDRDREPRRGDRRAPDRAARLLELASASC